MFRWILATRPTSLLAATLASFRCRFSHLRCEALNTDDLQSETARAWLDSMFHGLRKLAGLRGLRDGVGYRRGSRSALR